MVRYRTKLSQNHSLSWNKKLRQQQNYFLVQILRDLFNLKDQIKKNEFSIMKTPDQPKKTLMILVVKGKDKKKQKTAQTRLKKTKYFFLFFCQSSGEYELNSYTVQKRYTPSPARGVQNWVTTNIMINFG